MDIKKIAIPFSVRKPILAFGSQTKNTLCFAEGKHAYLSRVHANLLEQSDFIAFQKDAKHFLKINPEIIAYDLHPEYQSTKFALTLRSRNYDLRTIQHHHAHVASCMAENGLANKKVIGVAFDGTGFGSDGSLWGAEFLICDYKKFQRLAHLRGIPLLGGERAIVEPWRLAATWLYLIYGDNFLRFKTEFIQKIDKDKWRVLKNILLAGVNSPAASSMGRLFDAAASLILAKDKANFEAELAIELEKVATSCRLRTTSYALNIAKKKEGYIIDPRSIFKGIVQDLRTGESKAKMAYKFHLTVAKMLEKTCLILSKETGIERVVLSGGVFQNNLLLKASLDLLYKHNFKIFIHKHLSCNDASVSLGQAVIAGARES